MEENNPYKCDRCGYTTDCLSNLRRHLKRKNACEPKASEMSFEDVCKKYLAPPRDKAIECSTCGKKYTSRQGFYLHQKREQCSDELAASSARIQSLESVVLELKNEIADLKKEKTRAVVSVTNNHIVNNLVNQNVLVLNNYGCEDVSHLTHELLSHCLLNPSKGLPALIDNIHYNPNVPGNHNIRYKSSKNNSFEKYVDQHWMECDASNTLDELIRKGYRILNSHYTEHFMNNPDYFEHFRFLSDKTCTEYHSVKRDLRLLVKDRTMFLIASPS